MTYRFGFQYGQSVELLQQTFTKKSEIREKIQHYLFCKFTWLKLKLTFLLIYGEDPFNYMVSHCGGENKTRIITMYLLPDFNFTLLILQFAPIYPRLTRIAAQGSCTLPVGTRSERYTYKQMMYSNECRPSMLIATYC